MRTLSSFLVALVLVSQWLISIPHSHERASVGPGGHFTRPHLHLHRHSQDADHEGHHNHESDHGSPCQPLNDGQDHDSDAVYVTTATWLTNNANSMDLRTPDVSWISGEVSSSARQLQLLYCRGQGPPNRRGLQKCPVFLRTLSIRC